MGRCLEKVEAWNPVKSSCTELFKYVDLGSVDKDRKVIDESLVPEISCENAPSRARQLIQELDVLVATVRPNLNGVAMVQRELAGSTASTGYTVLRCSDGVLDSKYLFYWVQTPAFIGEMMSQATGASYPAVSDKIVKSSKIPLPPLSEQKKIATILDAADQLRQKDQQLIDHFTALSQSLFLEMFGDPVSNEHGFEKGTVRDILESANYGTSAKGQIEGEYPYLRMNNITYEGEMDFESLKYIDLTEKEEPKFLAQKGDILFNRTNSKELVGKTGLFNSETKMAIAGYLVRARVNERANPYFLWGYMNSKHGKAVLRHMCKSIVGMANINAQEFQNIKIVIPPLEKQRSFASRVSEIENQKNIVRANRDKSESLFNSLLQKAFKGELTSSKAA